MFNQLTKYDFHSEHNYRSYLKKTYEERDHNLFQSEHIESLIQLVGSEHLILRLYDKAHMPNGDILGSFFEVLGKKMPENLKISPDPNPRMPAAALPFLSTAILPMPKNIQLWRELNRHLYTAYTFPNGTGAGSEYLPELEREVAKINKYVPGYQDLYNKRPLSFSFPEVDVKDPHALFMTSILYTLLEKITAQEKMMGEQRKFLSNLIQANQFPNGVQRFFLSCYSPFLKLFSKGKYFKRFKENPKNFFLETKHPINKIFCKLLAFLGPGLGDTGKI